MEHGHDLVRDSMDEQIVRCVMHKKTIVVIWSCNLQTVNRVMVMGKHNVVRDSRVIHRLVSVFLCLLEYVVQQTEQLIMHLEIMELH